MKYNMLISIILISFLFVISGCSKDIEIEEEIVDTGDNTIDEEPDVVEIEVEETDSTIDNTEEIIKEVEEEPEEIIEEVIEDNNTEEAQEVIENSTKETANEINSISLENFKASQADWTIQEGDIIEWTNKMDNVRLTIAIYPQSEDGTFEYREINDRAEASMVPEDSYQYQFNESGEFKWVSLFKPNKMFGYITVE